MALRPQLIRQALAVPAASTYGDIRDVEHVVILMQENRSFDHYFGTLGGVRGYRDKATVPVRNGRSVWQQADGAGGIVTPFLMNGRLNATQHLRSLPHSWNDAHAAGNHGHWDGWVPAKGVLTMAGYTAQDLPFHRALAEAFTICDAYHCSIASSTNPNRAFLMSGTIDPLGQAGGPMLRQPKEDAGHNLLQQRFFSWKTYPERLQEAGIDWRIYQGVEEDGPFAIDPQDAITPRADSRLAGTESRVSCFNQFRFFQQYNDAPPGSPLHERAMQQRTLRDFEQDIAMGKLPAVSWICPPLACSEHPARTPAEGAMFIAAVLKALLTAPQVWSRTALFVTYDENDGFFDHILPPSPPTPHNGGLSNIDVRGEVNDDDGLAIGLGPRVPMLVISPWSSGRKVCSQVFDHTSVIRFLETRFGVLEPNISPWRRAVCGDLTSAFDFRKPSVSAPPDLPDTSHYRVLADTQRDLPPPGAATGGDTPAQAATQRIFLPLPYAHDIALTRDAAGVGLTFANTGSSAAVFAVFDLRRDMPPRFYTVAGSSEISDRWLLDAGRFDLYLLGPAGFLRHLRGSREGWNVDAVTAGGQLRFAIRNDSAAPVSLDFTDNYGGPPRTVIAHPAKHLMIDWPLAHSDNWYDVSVTTAATPDCLRRCRGHVETGRPSLSDPCLV